MGITKQFSKISTNIQDGVKTGSISLLKIFTLVLSGFFIALTFALIGQEIMQYGTISFCFVFIVFFSLTSKGLSKLQLGHILLFDLFCILVALLLRMYILVAP